MYTIKQAAARAGLTVPVLRAWERRYGIVSPARTPSGYRLYDDAAIARVSAMRRLVDSGMSPSAAAAEIASGRSAPPEPTPSAITSDGLAISSLVERFVAAAEVMDVSDIEAVLDAIFATGPVGVDAFGPDNQTVIAKGGDVTIARPGTSGQRDRGSIPPRGAAHAGAGAQRGELCAAQRREARGACLGALR